MILHHLKTLHSMNFIQSAAYPKKQSEAFNLDFCSPTIFGQSSSSISREPSGGFNRSPGDCQANNCELAQVERLDIMH